MEEDLGRGRRSSKRRFRCNGRGGKETRERSSAETRRAAENNDGVARGICKVRDMFGTVFKFGLPCVQARALFHLTSALELRPTTMELLEMTPMVQD